MKTLPQFLILARLLAPAVASAQSAVTTTLPVRAESRVWFDGTSTARSFSCKAGKLNGTVEIAAGQAATGLTVGQKAIKDVALTLPVASLGCGNGTMDDHMRKALKADANPTIKFTLSSYDLSGTTAKLNGKLSIAGQEKPITLNGTLSQDESGQMRLKGSKQINMTEWGVKPPSLMMGAMKVGEAVTVNYDMVVKP